MKSRSIVVGCVIGAAFVSGCGSSEGSGPEESTSTGSASEDDAASEEPIPTTEPTPTVAPATGEIIKVKGTRLRLPSGWVAGSASALQAGGYTRTDADSFISIFRFPQLLIESLEEQVREEATSSSWGSPPRREADRTVDGLVVTHLSGTAQPGERADTFSTLNNGQEFELDFVFGNAESRAERKQIVDSVLASWQFVG